MRVNFETVTIQGATSQDEAYGGLEEMVTRDLPVLVTRQSREIGYDIRSDRAARILAVKGLRAAGSTGVRENGLRRRHDLLGLHVDGFVGSEGMTMHHHETLELAPEATSSCMLIRAKRDKPSPLIAGGDCSRWADYVDMAEEELDDDLLYPTVYVAELGQGDTVDFWASGPVTMVHQFMLDPPTSNRKVGVTRIA